MKLAMQTRLKVASLVWFLLSARPCWTFHLLHPTSKKHYHLKHQRRLGVAAIPSTGLRLATSTSSSSTGDGGGTSTSSTSSTSISMKVVGGVRDLVESYDTFLLDMWGVMHDGSRPYEGVLDVIQQLRAAGKRLVILSNSSKRQDNSVRMLNKLGLDAEKDFELIITSGEVAFKMLGGDSPLNLPATTGWSRLQNVANHKAVVLGSGDGDVEYLEKCGWQVAPADEASLVVARGTFTVNDGTTVVHKNDDLVAYDTALQQMLQACARRRLPMLVTNPDKVRPDEGLPPMPGKLGDAYWEALKQEGVTNNGDAEESYVKRIGKPFSDVYEIALQSCSSKGNDSVEKTRVCMIGDALETDVTGGLMAGIATVWVLMDGIHSPDIKTMEDAANVLDKFNANSAHTYARGQTLQPDYLLSNFRW